MRLGLFFALVGLLACIPQSPFSANTPGFAAAKKKTDLQILGSQTAVNARKDFLLQIKTLQRNLQIWSFTSIQL